MKKIQRILPALVVIVAGCVAVDEELRTSHDGVISVESAVGESAQPAAEAHQGPWTAEELALRAGRRSQAMQEGALNAMIARLKADEDTAWRDPEFRYTGSWSDGDGFDDRDNKESSKSSNKFAARIYIPNPFINRYLSRKGDAEVRRSEAKAESAAFAVYSEVKLLCNEERRLTRELTLLSRRAAALEKSRDIAMSEATNSVARSPYTLIRSETDLRRNRVRLITSEFLLKKVRGNIAMLADVPVENLVITGSAFDASAEGNLDEERLVELAFARRPDLALAVAEYDAAVASAGVARAANIPWFRFVEAGYRFQDGEDSSIRRDGSRYSRGNDSDHDFSVEVAITVPLFTWCGNSVKATNRMRDLADGRVRSLRDSIRREIADAVAAYRLASSSVSDDDAAFVKKMDARIDGGAAEDAETSDSCKARVELVDYTIFVNDAAAKRGEALVNLETVIGGPVK